MESLLTQILEEQRKTNELLLMLIQGMAEDQDPEQASSTYMDGSPVL
ncbi:hypothetical protein BAY1663_02336 [Pseudomonas sp. BAY1663]|nr:hypothetical protein BAY1663_02336 [Pseudomonas sp. BAY1663]